MLHAQSQVVRLCPETLAEAVAQQATVLKSLRFAKHYEHLQQQMFFLEREQTRRWYVEAQHAVCNRLENFRRQCFLWWRMAACPMVQSTTTSKLALASLCREEVHLLCSAAIHAEEGRAWHHLSQVHAVTLTALRRTKLV